MTVTAVLYLPSLLFCIPSHAIPYHTIPFQVMLLRAEFMYGEASEVLVAEHTILGERRREKVLRPISFRFIFFFFDVSSLAWCCC